MQSSLCNMNRTVKCYFKRAYTTKTFCANIDPCKSREALYNKIFSLVNSNMFDNPLHNINDFEVIVAGQDGYINAEEANSFPPNNICIKNTVDFIGYDNIYAFYIKAKNIEIECPICYGITPIRSRRFACRHCFCNDCTNGWLNSCNLRHIITTCPMCRSDLLGQR